MVDKITTIPKAKIGARIGRLADEDMVRLNRAVLCSWALPLLAQVNPPDCTYWGFTQSRHALRV
jgi:hypothetical protein